MWQQSAPESEKLRWANSGYKSNELSGLWETQERSRQLSRGSAGEFRQMSGQVSRGSAGEYQADDWAGIAWTSWRLSETLYTIVLNVHKISWRPAL